MKEESVEVCFVIGSLNRGGAELHLGRVSSELAARGWGITIFCLSEAGKQAEIIESQGVRVIRPWRKRTANRNTASRVFALLTNFFQLFFYLLFTRPNIAHFLLPEAVIVGGLAARLARISFLVAERRSLNNYRTRRKILAPFESFVLRRIINIVLGNSRAVLDQLVDEGVNTEKIALIYNGVDFEKLETVRPLEKSDEKLTFVIVANLIPYKGHSDLLSALSAFSMKQENKWQIYCLGEDSGILHQLRDDMCKLGLEENVKWVGGVSNVGDYLTLSDIGLLVSHEEGFSNALLEYMAAGLPVIATNVGGSPEAVIDGETGILINPRAPQEIAAALFELANNKEKRLLMGENGRERSKQLFAIDSCVSRYETVYQALLRNVPLTKLCDTNRIPDINNYN